VVAAEAILGQGSRIRGQGHDAPEPGFDVDPEVSEEAALGGGVGGARKEALAGVLAAVQSRWGHGSIVRLDRDEAAKLEEARRLAREADAPRRWHELPAWWPRALPSGEVVRPATLEIVGEAGSGRLALTLLWLAAAQPTLAAFVQGGLAIYPPAVAGAGVPLSHLVLVRPPSVVPSKAHHPSTVHRPPSGRWGGSRGALDATALLLRSEAFDAVACPLGAEARVSTGFASKLATLASRSGTSLLLLTSPAARAPALGAFAEYRVRLTQRKWLWEDGELAGMKLRVATERSRTGEDSGATHKAGFTGSAGSTNDAVEHELTLRLHRAVRDGVYDAMQSAKGKVQSGGVSAAPEDGWGDRLFLQRSMRLRAEDKEGADTPWKAHGTKSKSRAPELRLVSAVTP
jgi:hypothetical protein